MRRRRWVVAITAGVLALSSLGAALADDTEAVDLDPDPEIFFDETEETITIALPLDGELPDCTPEEEGEEGEGGEEAEGGEGEEAEDEVVVYSPGDCIVFDVDHPSGKFHHGALVSTVATSLHPSMLDGIKKGEIMRWVAKYKDYDVDFDDLDFEAEGADDDDDGDGPPDHAKDKSNNGNGKANGKNKNDG